MQINEAEVIVCCDVDGTLVRPVDALNPSIFDKLNGVAKNVIEIKNPYDGAIYYYQKHLEHISLLRQYKGRGFFIRVWSAAGVKHAVSVVKALGLDDGTVDSVETKPMKNVDDKKSSVHIVGSRVFIPNQGWVEET